MKEWTLATMIAFILTATMMMAFLNDAGGEEVNKFYTPAPKDQDYVVLKGDGNEMYDPHMYFQIERNVPISNARLDVTTIGSDTGPWIKDPMVDVGADGNNEWEFSGTGYGDFGRNTVYSDDETQKTNRYPSAREINLGDVLLPADASVYSAEMTIKGRFEADIHSTETAAEGGKISYTPDDVRIGDIDGDNLNDALVSTGTNGNLYKYIQNSNGAYEKTRLSAPTTYNDYVLYDVDEDGDLDIVYSTSSGISYVENTGSGSFSSTGDSLTTSFTPSKLILGDIDGDSEDEIIGAEESWSWSSSTQAIGYLKRDNGTDFDLWPLFDTGSGSGSSTLISIKIDDWNDDDYPDVYAAFTDRKVYTFENPAYEWYYNDTSNITTKSDWSSRNVFTSSYSISDWDVGDVDGDGEADVAIAPSSYYSDINYYRNRGTSSWTRYNVVSFTIYYPKAVAIVDLDGDDKLDIFFSSGSYYYNNRIGWCANNGNPNRNSWPSYTLMSGHDNAGQSAFRGDVDSDGYEDVGLFFSSNRQIIVWKNLAPHDGSAISAGFIEDGGLSALADLEKADIDGDGDDDLVITAFESGTVGWYENDGTPTSGSWDFHRINGVIVSGAKEVAIGDIDNDGDLDVAVTAYGMGRIMWFEAPDDPKGIWKYHYVGSMNYAYGCGLGDFDDDGQLDIVVSGGYYWSDGVRMYYTSNPEGSWSYRRISNSVSYCGAINVTDMNKDGYEDVIVTTGGWSGQASIYRNPMPGSNPRSRQWQQITAVSGLQYAYEALPIDINEDGNLDVVASSNYGGVKWAQAPSNVNAVNGWNTYTMTTSINYPWGLEVGDIDDDGYDDVFVTAHYWWGSSWYVYGRGFYWLEETDDPYSTWERRTFDSNMPETYGITFMDHDDDGSPEIYAVSYSDSTMKYHAPTLNYASDISLDLGGDNLKDYERPGSLRGDLVVDLKEEIQRVLDLEPSSMSVYTDANGNRMAEMSMELYSATLGRLTGHSIDIRYNVTMRVDNNGALRDSISRLIPDYTDPNEDSIRLYLNFKGRSEGTALISNLSVEYNAPPKLAKALPKTIDIDENTVQNRAMDLAEFFKDDYDSSDTLNYEVEMVGAHKDKVAAYIEDGSFLTIDSRIDPDFDRDTNLRIMVTDNGGANGVPARIFTSNTIKIDVIPVDDHPVRWNQTLPERLIAYEGQETLVIDLKDYNLFYDVDDPLGSGLRYWIEIDPNGIDPRNIDNITWKLTKTSQLYITSPGDWHGTGIPIRVWAFDNGWRDPENDPYHDTVLDVLNINDPPSWTAVSQIVIEEDEEVEGTFDLTPYVIDIDSDPARELTFELLSYTNSSFYLMSMNLEDNSKFDFTPRVENWNGWIDAVIEVSDGEYSAITQVQVRVLPVNDEPWIKIVSPINKASLDEGPISVQGDAYDVEGIESIVITYFGEDFEIKAFESWGHTLPMPDEVDITEITYNIPIKVTLTDTDGAIVEDSIEITLIPEIEKEDPDLDNDDWMNSQDDFPEDPSEWRDTDRDGMGDNEDAFPENAEWKYDTDKDGIADIADEYPYDPMNEEVTPPPPPPKEEKVNWTGPIIFFILVAIALAIAVIAIVSFVGKRRASKDPRKSVAFYRKQEKRRELFKKISGREKIESVLTRTHIDADKIKRPGSAGPTPSALPQRSPMGLPQPSRAQPGQRMQQLPPPGRRMPPPPPRR